MHKVAWYFSGMHQEKKPKCVHIQYELVTTKLLIARKYTFVTLSICYKHMRLHWQIIFHNFIYLFSYMQHRLYQQLCLAGSLCVS